MTQPEPIISPLGDVRHVGVLVDVGEFNAYWRWLPICGEQAKRWKLPETWAQTHRPWCSRCSWKSDRIQELTRS